MTILCCRGFFAYILVPCPKVSRCPSLRARARARARKLVVVIQHSMRWCIAKTNFRARARARARARRLEQRLAFGRAREVPLG